MRRCRDTLARLTSAVSAARAGEARQEPEARGAAGRLPVLVGFEVRHPSPGAERDVSLHAVGHLMKLSAEKEEAGEVASSETALRAVGDVRAPRPSARHPSKDFVYCLSLGSHCRPLGQR